MKILYVAHDKRAAEEAARSLRAAVPGVRLVWAASFGEALRWIDGNRGVLAVVVEVESDIPSCELFVDQLRALKVGAPVVVVTVNDTASRRRTLSADEIVAKGPSFFTDLPQIIGRVLRATRPGPAPGRPPLQFLYIGDAALARKCFAKSRSIDVIEALPEFKKTLACLPIEVRSGAPLAVDVVFIEHGYPDVDTHAILNDIAARQLRVPVVIVAEWDAAFAAQSFKLGAIDYVVKSSDSFQAVVFRMGPLLAHAAHLRAREGADASGPAHAQTAQERQALDDQLAATEAALREAERRLDEEKRAARERLAEAEASLQMTEQLRLAESEHHTRREATLLAELRGAAAAREQLERRVADADDALRLAGQRAAEQSVAQERANERHAHLESELARQAANAAALERQLAGAKFALQHAEHQHASEMTETTTRLADRHQEAETRVVGALAAVDALESKLRDAVAALARAEEHAAHDRRAATDAAALRQADFDRQLAAEAARSEALARHVADAEKALQQSEQRRASEMNEAVARLSATERMLADVATERQQADEQHASAIAAAAARLADHEQEAERRLADARAAADALEARLRDAVAALGRAEENAAIERQAAADEAALQRAEFDDALSIHAAARQTLAQQLSDSESARERAEERHAAELAAAAARLADQQRQGETRLAEAMSATEVLQGRLRDALAALARAEETATVERRSAADEAALRQAQFDDRLQTELAAREAIAAQLSDTQKALQHSEQRHASQMKEATARLNETERVLAETSATLRRVEQEAAAARQAAVAESARRHSEFEAELATEVARREALAKQMADAESVRRQAEERHASEIAAAAARLADHQQQAETRLADARAASDALEIKLRDTVAALARADEQAARDRQAAADDAARRREEFDRQLAARAADAEALAKKLMDAETALQQAEQRRASEMTDAAARLAAAERALADTSTALEAARAEQVATRQDLQNALIDAETAHQRVREHEASIERIETARRESENALANLRNWTRQLESDHEKARANFDRARTGLEGDVARQRAEHAALQQTLAEAKADAEEKLREQATRHRASDEAAARTLADVEHRLKVTLEAGYRDRQAITDLQEQLKALETRLQTARLERDTLKTEADRVPRLRKDIDDIRAEHRRQFDHAPVNLCRCTEDGSISLANHALARLLGYETPEELQRVDLAASVFESADELPWIIERCLASRATESVETTWTKKDGSRIIVRLLAAATGPDSIDITAEDITTLRVLEEKLRIAQRMEAVARYASEVAVTCDHLLGHVEQEGLRWLARIDSDTARYHGELLLDEVTRAAKYLRQLAVYGNEEKKVPELVDMNKVLRDLEPVLRRVAGSDIDLVLPKAAAPLNLDVDAERVERMLVNVAAYGRERMPRGGRLMFEVAPVVLDRKFVAKYPNVRPGAHVLLTVNEVRSVARPELSGSALAAGSPAASVAPVSNSPGVDLGALQALVSDCGGHLWMMAEPPGDMVLKIHLPRRALDHPEPRARAKASVRTRWVNRATGVRH